MINPLWLYSIKTDCEGNIIAKARLMVAQGCADKNNYSEKDVFAAVAPIEIVRFFISIAIVKKLQLTAFDVSTAFLYGEIKEDVLLCIPQGLSYNRHQFALKLNKSIYGLRVSGKNWFDKFISVVQDFGFIQLIAEKCLFIYRDGHHYALLLSYVDDILVATTSDDLTKAIRAHFETNFKIKFTSNPKIFLSLELHFQPECNVMLINQRNYIEQVARTFNLTTGRMYNTPMEHALKITKTAPNDDLTFRKKIGALSFLARFSRPDIALAVNYLSTFQGYVTNEINSYVNRIIRYSYCTRNLALQYIADDADHPLFAYIDASHAPQADSKSVSGCIIFHYTNPIDWHVIRQSCVARSSTAAEINALSDMLDYFLIPREILIETFQESSPVIVYEDNQSATAVIQGGNHKNLRWTVIKANAVIEQEQLGNIKITQILGTDQLADSLTKPVDRHVFEKFREKILVEMRDN